MKAWNQSSGATSTGGSYYGQVSLSGIHTRTKISLEQSQNRHRYAAGRIFRRGHKLIKCLKLIQDGGGICPDQRVCPDPLCSVSYGQENQLNT